VGVQVLCRSKEVMSVEVLTGNVDVSRVVTTSVDIRLMSPDCYTHYHHLSGLPTLTVSQL